MTNDMFATYDNVDEVIEWCNGLDSDSRIYALTAAMIMMNTIHHMATQEQIRQEAEANGNVMPPLEID